MTEIPRIVRQRLEAQASGKVCVHPDADLLTAFCERTLTENERRQVIGHLALCADCRDAVALAAPPQLAEGEPLRPHPAPRRFGWVHWFALAASVVVVATAVLQQPRRSQPGSELEMATRERAPAPAAKPSAQPQNGKTAAMATTTASGPTSTPAQTAASAEHADRSALVKDIAEEQPPKRDESPSKPVAQSEFREYKQQANAPSQPGSGSGRAGTGTGAGAGGVVGGIRTGTFGAGQPTKPASSAASLEKERRDAPQAPPPPARANEAAAVEDNRRPADALKSKDAEVPKAELDTGARKSERQLAVADSDSTAGGKEAAGQPVNQEALDQKSRAQAPATELGSVQPGALSAKKRPAETQTKTSRLASLTNKLKTPLRWTISAAGMVQRSLDGGKSWQDLAIAEGVRFRAVAAQDGNVWAGGDGGALFHSSDGGATWTPRPLSGAAYHFEMTPAFDILRIDITASGQVTVTTSQRQTFVSTDAGNTWSRQ
ncbi:MAG: YCF48-related protein [Terriglobales bacterium]